MPLALIIFLTFLATFLGGLFALRFRDKLHLILGFSAGAMIGLVFFDLLPESLEMAGNQYSSNTVTLAIALGFLFYTVLDRMILLHHHSDEHCESRQHRSRGQWGAGSLAAHSFLDGLAIGLAFQVSSIVGSVVTAAVLTHDFSDGINTVGLILKSGGSKQSAFRWLLLDALAPIAGITATLFFSLPQEKLGLLMALFCGFFLYIGASELLPESHHGHPKRLTTLMTLLGAGILYLVVKLAG